MLRHLNSKLISIYDTSYARECFVFTVADEIRLEDKKQMKVEIII